MQQNFVLKIAKESLSGLKSNTLITHIKNIKITANLEIVNHLLKVSFDILIPTKLQPDVIWHTLDDNSFQQKDFLWEDTCLECFIGDSTHTEYIEINASPKGYFSIYHFDDYRTPKSMPPRALAINSTENAIISWQKQTDTYQRTFMFDMDSLPNQLKSATLFNPTLILYLKKNHLPLFFAKEQATPADFHDQNFWIPISV